MEGSMMTSKDYALPPHDERRIQTLEMYLRLPVSPKNIALSERLSRIEHRLSIVEERRSGVLDSMVMAPLPPQF